MSKILLLPCLFISHSLVANEALWTDIEQSYQFRSNHAIEGTAHTARRLKLNIEQLQANLDPATTPENLLEGALLELPLPDGRFMKFHYEPTQVMAPALAQQFPNIKTWRIYNPENPAISGRIDIGPHGFHGLINTVDGDRIFIDPDPATESHLYTSLSRRANEVSVKTDFQCKHHHHNERPSFAAKPEIPSIANYKSLNNPADALITYRLAVAATGEYTQMMGGSKEKALAAIVTTVNRLNQVYERDLSLHLQLIANNDKIIYTSASTDPYTNEDAVAMVDENIININSVIGNSQYDIGHVFGTGNTGGLAFIKSTCGLYKAGGVTGSNSPSGDAFNIDYVAHEIGHQLGGSHTFNGHQLNCSAGNRTASTAVEPGSGSSIMAYAGICGTDNLQTHSDAFFHSSSIAQIKQYTRHGSGANCGTRYQVENNKPTVDAGADFTIPAQTPFVLTGNAQDEDQDSLLHSWEQTDTGSAGGLYTDLGNNPLFRIWPPTTNTHRFFPRLSDLLNQTKTVGETLPSTDRSMNFNLLVRDNNGGLEHDAMAITVVNTGTPFSVISQATETSLSAGQSVLVDWEVAGTREPPINCKYVTVKLLEESGTSTLLLDKTSNDGSERVTIPTTAVSLHDSHIAVQCHDNIFFAVSKGNVHVLGGDPILSANSPSITEENSGSRNLSFILSLSAKATNNVIIDYHINDHANGTTIQRGQVVIVKGSQTVSIHVPIPGDTIYEQNQLIELTISKPVNAQFANAGHELKVIGTIIDDDTVIAANPELPVTSTSPNTNSGGGSTGLLSLLALLLLPLRYRLKGFNHE